MPKGGAQFDPVLKQRAVFKCTQSGTGAPAIAFTLENSLDDIKVPADITIGRTGAGVYTLTKTGAWKANRTIAKAVVTSATARICNPVYTSADVITLNFSDLATPSAADSGAFDLTIEIYNQAVAP